MTAPDPGCFALFLHGHLPWVLRYGRWPHGAEWLCEAAIGTYVPLVQSLRSVRRDGIVGGITIGVSPILAEQLSRDEFRAILRDYLEDRIRTARTEHGEFSSGADVRLERLAQHWLQQYEKTRSFFFDELGGDLLGALRELEEDGVVELATCAATHGYLPLLGRDETIALQIGLAKRVHTRHFGRPPRGIWLPEAAYRPSGAWSAPEAGGEETSRDGIEEFLARYGFDYFIVDSSLLVGARHAAEYPLERAPTEKAQTPPSPANREVYRPHWIARTADAPRSAFFTRDPVTGLQVWSGQSGYPGDSRYLEFHKKSDGGGQRYWQVTGPGVDLGLKEPYDLDAARERVREHSKHFRGLVSSTLESAGAGSVLVAPYDAELFGHWWYEGVAWIEAVLREMARDPRLTTTTLGDHFANHPPRDVLRLPEGSWGRGGKHEVWSNANVSWTWKLIYPLEDDAWNLWERACDADHAEAKAVVRAALRQVLLLVASDWQFLITTETALDYATERIREHAESAATLNQLARRMLEGGELSASERERFARIERRDDVFPELEDAIEEAVRHGTLER